MKKLLSLIFATGISVALAQPKGKEAKMAPVTVPGYYVSMKGDTVRGEIQTNSGDETNLYLSINFKAKGAAKVTPITTKKAKAYGFEGRHFVLVPYDAETEVYLERIVSGRLNFFERKTHQSKEGEDVISSSYYIQDTRAEEKDADLKEIKPISTNFYKKDLKPYMKDQPTTWSDLDKFSFNRQNVMNAIKEFNKYYEQAPE